MSFVSAAIGAIREQAKELEGREAKLDFATLAAHLFAIGSQLLLNEGSARLMDRLTPQALDNLEDLRRRLAGISANTDASTLYQKIIEALVTIQSELVRDPSFAAALLPFTDLKPLPSGGFRGIHGRVYHWMRPLSALEKIRYDRIREAKSHPPDPSPHPGIYLDRLALYWDSDPQLPRVSRVPAEPRISGFFQQSGADAAIRKRFRLALCPLEGPFHPRFSVDPQGRFFRALSQNAITEPGELAAHLEAILDTAAENEVNLILLPELTVDPDARSHLRNKLQERSDLQSPLYGIVAGSFHFWAGGPTTAKAPEPPPVNEAVFLDPTGSPVAIHHKRGRFRVAAAHVTDSFFPEKPDKLCDEIFEDIRYGSELQIFETSLGRLALLICADAIAADDRGYLPVIRRLRPDLLLVVSMTAETEPFDAFAEEMSRYWIGTIFVNAHCICHRGGSPRNWLSRLFARLTSRSARTDHGPNLAACDLALHQNPGCPPTRVRWRYGRPEPDCFFFKLEGKKKVWRSLSAAPRPTGITLLERDGKTLGLVLDLGVHWDGGKPKGK